MPNKKGKSSKKKSSGKKSSKSSKSSKNPPKDSPQVGPRGSPHVDSPKSSLKSKSGSGSKSSSPKKKEKKSKKIKKEKKSKKTKKSKKDKSKKGQAEPSNGRTLSSKKSSGTFCRTCNKQLSSKGAFANHIKSQKCLSNKKEYLVGTGGSVEELVESEDDDTPLDMKSLRNKLNDMERVMEILMQKYNILQAEIDDMRN